MTENANMVQLENETTVLLDEFMRVQFELKRLEKIAKEMKERVLFVLNNKPGSLVSEHGEVVAEYKIQDREMFDQAWFKQENPALFERYKKVVGYKMLKTVGVEL